MWYWTASEGIEPVSGRLYQLGITGLEIEDEQDFKDFLEAFTILVRHIGKLPYDKFIQQDTINRFEITGLFASQIEAKSSS